MLHLWDKYINILLSFSFFFYSPCFILSNNHVVKFGIGDKLDNCCIAGNSVVISLATSFIK